MKRKICILIASAWLCGVPQLIEADTIEETVVAKMPCDDKDEYNAQMYQLVMEAPNSIYRLAKMLKPREEACNSKVEYALCGAVAFCSTNGEWSKKVKEGLEKYFPDAIDEYAKEFIQQQLRLLSTEEDVSYIELEGQKTYTSAYAKLEKTGAKGVLKAVGSKDRLLRMQALKYAAEKGLMDDELATKVTKKYSSLSEDAKADIINWIGDNKVESQIPLLLQATEEGGELSKASIEALGRIGGDEAARNC